jgi:hypothetical protein
VRQQVIQLFLAALILVGGTSLPAEAQLLKVDSKYRIVTVDRPGQRIGVALPDANPKERQSWVYIKPHTQASMRKYYGDGFFKDEKMSFNGIFNAAEQRIGKVFRVKGGRDFDKSINAKKVWF